LNAVGITVNKQIDLQIKGLWFKSSGLVTDGNNTIAIKWAPSAAHQRIIECQGNNFSGAVFFIPQCVNFVFRDCILTTNKRGWVFESHAGFASSAVRIVGGYVTGSGDTSTDGVCSEVGMTAYSIENTIFEYCGDPAGITNSAAINIRGGFGDVTSTYFESNYRNFRLEDTQCSRSNMYELPGVYPSIFTWTGVGFADRGYSNLGSRALTITDIIADTTSESAIRVGGPLSTSLTPATIFSPTSGVVHHYKAPECRVRYEGATAAQSWETVVGGGGIGGGGWFSVFDGNSGVVRLEVQPGTGAFGIRGNDAGMELWVNGQKVIGTRGAALPADATDLPTAIALANAIKARMVAHGLVA
jgi:hypothetical protein